MNNLKEYDMDDNIDDITTRVIKLANGESIVCTCIPSRTDEGSDKLHIIHPLKMEMRNRITPKGQSIEALTLSRWLQPFTESDEFDIEKASIITITPASYALNNYYNFMVSTYTEADANNNFEPTIQPKFSEEMPDDEQEESTDEVRRLFKQYISALTGGRNNDEDDPIEELSEEQFDSMPCSETKH